ncbi:MAG: demethoxyubiquinone hydroxylase family protein [Betaproteobacteria bacterium]|nr:demethoxyubiquinone hydroxylase family protein [Betaproteobacteria bacterium]
MPTPASQEPLTVLYDGACPLCRREIAHARGLARRQGDESLCFVDISAEAACPMPSDERAALLARFHVERADGSRLSGAAAFVAMWRRLPGWRWLARIADLPGGLAVMEFAYRGFLRMRPAMQALARRLEPGHDAAGTPVEATGQPSAGEAAAAQTATTAAPTVSGAMLRELRSDHAGETGAVFIYRGILAVAARRGDAAMTAFANHHLATEAEHLRLIEAWLPPRQRSRLLGPWRLAGWLTGALPALAGPRSVYATIAAVERFVDGHYQQQIDHLQREGGPAELLALLRRCQADERHHRDEALAAGQQAGPSAGLWLRGWCALIGSGSAAAVVVARRV